MSKYRECLALVTALNCTEQSRINKCMKSLWYVYLFAFRIEKKPIQNRRIRSRLNTFERENDALVDFIYTFYFNALKIWMNASWRGTIASLCVLTPSVDLLVNVLQALHNTTLPAWVSSKHKKTNIRTNLIWIFLLRVQRVAIYTNQA